MSEIFASEIESYYASHKKSADHIKDRNRALAQASFQLAAHARGIGETGYSEKEYQRLKQTVDSASNQVRLAHLQNSNAVIDAQKHWQTHQAEYYELAISEMGLPFENFCDQLAEFLVQKGYMTPKKAEPAALRIANSLARAGYMGNTGRYNFELNSLKGLIDKLSYPEFTGIQGIGDKSAKPLREFLIQRFGDTQDGLEADKANN